MRPKMALRSRSRRAALALALLVFGVISPVTASVTSAAGTTKPEIRLSGEAARRLLSAYDHTYKLRETVPLYANKVGPFHNPSEVRRARSPRPAVAAGDSSARSFWQQRRTRRCPIRPPQIAHLRSRTPDPQTYQYYDLPFCEPVDGKVSKREDLGEVLEGDRDELHAVLGALPRGPR